MNIWYMLISETYRNSKVYFNRVPSYYWWLFEKKSISRSSIIQLLPNKGDEKILKVSTTFHHEKIIQITLADSQWLTRILLVSLNKYQRRYSFNIILSVYANETWFLNVWFIHTDYCSTLVRHFLQWCRKILNDGSSQKAISTVQMARNLLLNIGNQLLIFVIENSKSHHLLPGIVNHQYNILNINCCQY